MLFAVNINLYNPTYFRLWDVINLSTFIFWSLRKWTVDVIEHSKILATSNQISQACITAITKPERRSHPSGGHSHSYHPVTATTSYIARILNTLERGLTLYLFHGKKTLDDFAVTRKQRQSMMREFAVDIVRILILTKFVCEVEVD